MGQFNTLTSLLRTYGFVLVLALSHGAYAASRLSADDASSSQADAEQWLVQGRLAMYGTEPTEAVHLLYRAVDAGSVAALAAVGELYEYGLGLPRSDKEAMLWYRRAAAEGEAEGRAHLGLMLVRSNAIGSLDEGVELIRQASAQGSAFGQFALAQLELQGQGVQADEAQAVRLLEDAASRDLPAAKSLLGQLYLEGRGVATDSEKALALLTDAARQGDVGAQSRLGVVHRDGLGVERDDIEAAYWLDKAAERGDDEARSNLGLLLLQSADVSRDAERAVALLRQAAEHGQVTAQFQLGLCLLDGDGVAQDREQGLRWVRNAASRGFAQAKDYVEGTIQ